MKGVIDLGLQFILIVLLFLQHPSRVHDYCYHQPWNISVCTTFYSWWPEDIFVLIVFIVWCAKRSKFQVTPMMEILGRTLPRWCLYFFCQKHLFDSFIDKTYEIRLSLMVPKWFSTSFYFVTFVPSAFSIILQGELAANFLALTPITKSPSLLLFSIIVLHKISNLPILSMIKH